MKKFSKLMFIVLAYTACVGIVAMEAFAGGDSANGRPSYTLNEINTGKLGDNITFNSISDGKIGNEKNFVAAVKSPVTSDTKSWNSDMINVEDGGTYTIRLYVHNNSPKGLSAIAEDVTAQFVIPDSVSTEQTVTGYLNSSNASPVRYWDEVKLISKENVYLKYVKGSAKYTNSIGTFNLSDDIIGKKGVKLGYNSMNGKIPGCYEYDGVVTVEVEVHKSHTTLLKNYARVKGSGTAFSEGDIKIDAKVGDEIEFRIKYVNLLDSQVNNIMIRDVLPHNMDYVKNSTYIYNSKYPNGAVVKDDTIVTNGINIGNYLSKGNTTVVFTAKIVNKTLSKGTNQLVNWASATVNNEVFKDDVSIMVDYNGD